MYTFMSSNARYTHIDKSKCNHTQYAHCGVQCWTSRSWQHTARAFNEYRYSITQFEPTPFYKYIFRSKIWSRTKFRFYALYVYFEIILSFSRYWVPKWFARCAPKNFSMEKCLQSQNVDTFTIASAWFRGSKSMLGVGHDRVRYFSMVIFTNFVFRNQKCASCHKRLSIKKFDRFFLPRDDALKRNHVHAPSVLQAQAIERPHESGETNQRTAKTNF